MKDLFKELMPFEIENRVTRKRAVGPIQVPIEIETLEGKMVASVGDYIIEGLNGEYYPCKPDIFEKSYIRTASFEYKND